MASGSEKDSEAIFAFEALKSASSEASHARTPG